MLLEATSIRDLHNLLLPHMDKPVWPGLTRRRAGKALRERARRLGLWQQLGEACRASAEPTVLRRSLYRQFVRTGVRRPCDYDMHARLSAIQHAALALWLEHPAAHVDRLQDLLWAACDQQTWVMCAHEHCHVDLGSSHVGRLLAEILWMLQDRLEAEVVARVRQRIAERVLEPVADYRRLDWWATAAMNWNHVCNANLITAALYEIRDAHHLANYVHPLIQRLDYAIQGFSDDGGCREGPGYWNYGFGHYLDAAVVLRQRTGGALDLMDSEKIRRICAYPLAAHMADGLFVPFADAHRGRGGVALQNALKVNRFHRLPALFAITAEARGGETRHKGGVPGLDWRTLCLHRGVPRSAARTPQDHVLPDLGQAVLRTADGCTVLAVLAGDNGVPHNHNDVGTFVLYRHGTCLLTDPGAPTYTRKTFSPERYEIPHCRSRGHSVPVVNGREQSAGAAFRGTLSATGPDRTGAKAVAIDMAAAYAEPSLRRLLRTFTLAADGSLTLVDEYSFRHMPRALEEAFVTLEPARLLPGGRGVAIGRGRRTVRLTCTSHAGRFAVSIWRESAQTDPHGEAITRITFRPRRLQKAMALAFGMR